MFKTLTATFPTDRDYPERAFMLAMLSRVLNGTIYDNLKYAFHDEKNGANEYIKLRERRPSVRYNLCKLVVDDSVSLLFSEGHFPRFDCGKNAEDVQDALQRISKEIALNEIMIDAATRGSIGSVAILFRVLSGRIFLDVMDTPFLTPVYRADAPDTLESVTERYKVKGNALADDGYAIANDDMGADFWFQRTWNADQEIWYTPQKVGLKDVEPSIDAKNTITHSLGFVPVVWIKNLPGGCDVDGACTFPQDAINTSIEIDYQLSQAGRGLKYSSDPTLLIKEPSFSDKQIVRSASNAITVDAQGDAKLLEINGTAATAVMDYVRMLRELAIESMHGNRANADKLSAAQSGRALELMNQALVWLADRLRISYGEGALLSIINMIVAASAKLPLTYKDGSKIGDLTTTTPIALRWPAWYQPTSPDMQQTAVTLRTLCDSGLMSRMTAINVLSSQYDIEDAEAEKAMADAEMAERNATASVNAAITE